VVNVLIYLVSPHRVWTLDEKYPRLIAEKFPSLEVVCARSKEESLDRLPQADVLYAWTLPEKHLDAAARLDWLHSPSAGVDELLYPALVQSDIRVTCSRGISSAALADHALGMILAHSRGLAIAVREQAEGRWARDRFFSGDPMPAELDGKAVGILGFGSIGREVARRARAFGMKVHALKRNKGRKDDLVDRIYGPPELDPFLEAVDFLVVALPLTRRTEGILDEAAFQRMRKGAFLVNLARGRLIREDALLGALESGRLAGAGLDVFFEEPLPPGSPLYRLPNVILTPHVGGLHPNYLDRATSIFLVNLGRYLRNETLLHQVDKREGY
jgi:phosphoglycerate dehydrogenase-like enzyme